MGREREERGERGEERGEERGRSDGGSESERARKGEEGRKGGGISASAVRCDGASERVCVMKGGEKAGFSFSFSLFFPSIFWGRRRAGLFLFSLRFH